MNGIYPPRSFIIISGGGFDAAHRFLTRCVFLFSALHANLLSKVVGELSDFEKLGKALVEICSALERVGN